ncbi:hypothetical protein HT136_08460 [Novosphingobium profundi]|uniref:hypothetical protein n=1 Tax=Novosphingobium profundi TaxID=1774954 RepID=UPI001BD93DB8|nr:hypothetical protein [Novosphingobium profundi]MBT0668400.1 hypothetical protein [Novosphingobium profundi]
MAIDPERGSFVQQEYRYAESINNDVLAEQSQARVIPLDTNLDMEAAQALADEVLAEQRYVSQAYSVTFQGVDVIEDEDLVGSPPTFLCNFYDWPVRVTERLTTISVNVDYKNWITTVVMKGPIK